jgi:hypothetical protein
MIPDRNDEQLLDRIVDALREQPIPKGPPDDVRQRVVALGEGRSQPTSVGAPSHWTWLADWIGTVAVVTVLLAVLDFAWWRYVNATKPVGWFRDRATDTWHVMYDNTRVEIQRPSAERKDA